MGRQQVPYLLTVTSNRLRLLPNNVSVVSLEDTGWGGKGGKGVGNEGVPKMVLPNSNIFLCSSMIKKDEKLSLLL